MTHDATSSGRTGGAPAEPLRPPQAFAALVIEWQRTHGRQALPWQHTRDPYRVWLSEIMLQQTQVATVLGYYERFLTRFPTVEALACAPLDDVLAAWSGLGYYRRARHLHAAARAVVELHGGRFPATAAGLATLPGIGRSTAAAIAAFCYGERAAILDGNVKRVLTRVLAFDGDLADPRHERVLWQHAGELLPQRGIETYTQGLMDLGAILCSPRAPACLLCPVRQLCLAAREGTQERYPVKSRRSKRGERSSAWLWLTDAGERVWLVQRPDTGVWAGLWSLPEFDDPAELAEATAAWPGTLEALPGFVHALTHFDWTLHPFRLRLAADADSIAPAPASRWATGRWFELAEALALGLPSPLRKLLDRSRPPES